MPARRLLARLHAWIGAVAAPVLLLVCLSGAALAFDAELFRAQHPFVRSVDGAAARVAAPRVDAWLAAAKRGYGRSFQPLGLFLPDSRVEVDTAMFYGLRSGAGGLEDTVILVVDPATGAYRGDFLLDSAWGHQLIHFHHQLFAGEVGAAIVALLGLLLAAFAATGLYLWWPRRGSAWRKARPPHLSGRPLGRWYRIHGWIGFWSALPILFFGLTGTAASHSGWFGGLLAGLPYDVPPRSPPPSRAPAPAASRPTRPSPPQAPHYPASGSRRSDFRTEPTPIALPSRPHPRSTMSRATRSPSSTRPVRASSDP